MPEKAKTQAAWAAKARPIEASIIRERRQSSASPEPSPDEGEDKAVEETRATGAANAHRMKVKAKP